MHSADTPWSSTARRHGRPLFGWRFEVSGGGLTKCLERSLSLKRARNTLKHFETLWTLGSSRYRLPGQWNSRRQYWKQRPRSPLTGPSGSGSVVLALSGPFLRSSLADSARWTPFEELWPTVSRCTGPFQERLFLSAKQCRGKRSEGALWPVGANLQGCRSGRSSKHRKRLRDLLLQAVPPGVPPFRFVFKDLLIYWF